MYAGWVVLPRSALKFLFSILTRMGVCIAEKTADKSSWCSKNANNQSGAPGDRVFARSSLAFMVARKRRANSWRCVLIGLFLFDFCSTVEENRRHTRLESGR
ncbi:hypothetical protein JAAARDRAFT_394844 [Jaapia argillacea MUCL 33604]|uniref:Secreted protein n=1 Tax=Jaapia argillacea MUCL 33604 TaxID=933084 RepID=A0A067PKV6_9AGAM|nr:hypothetical protein JAAARDRAFT_394844 [Jaapia argillacea MUCL 33604]